VTSTSEVWGESRLEGAAGIGVVVSLVEGDISMTDQKADNCREIQYPVY